MKACERIGAVSLPTWAAPPVMIQPLSSTSRAMKIGISSKTVDLKDLSMIAYWKIRARLLDVPGVANAPIWGERIKSPQVQVDQERPARGNLRQRGGDVDGERKERGVFPTTNSLRIPLSDQDWQPLTGSFLRSKGYFCIQI